MMASISFIKREFFMSGNSFGVMFRFTTFGESHGPAIGVIVDGVPPRLSLREADIQIWLDKRRPGQSSLTTQRQEPDRVRILSGVYEGRTTGTPIGLLIANVDSRAKDYADILATFRPGHADYTYWKKYGIRDPLGGGRSSARETVARVAAGAIARIVLGSAITVRGAIVQLGTQKIDRSHWDWMEVTRNPFFCPDPVAVQTWERYLGSVRKRGSSIGAVIEVTAEGVPPGLGAPVYDKLDADIAKALMSINAVKGVEIGAGFAAAKLFGEENADEMSLTDEGQVCFLSNNAGGILGGISSGQAIITRLAIKPTSSIMIPQRTIDVSYKEQTVVTRGRHDPCVGLRAVPVAEAMVACTLADHMLRQRAQCG